MIVTLFLYKGLNLYSVFANVNNNGNANNNNASVVGGGVAPDFVKVLYADIFVNSLTKGDFFPPHALIVIIFNNYFNTYYS